MHQGVFAEQPNDPHVGLRSDLLGRGGSLPHLRLDVLESSAADFDRAQLSSVIARLRDEGISLVQFDEPLSNDRYLEFGAAIGELEHETSDAVQPYVDSAAILNLVSDRGVTSDVALQPFATNFLTLHTEGSGRALDDQPRFIALMCCDPGDPSMLARTVLKPMSSVANKLTAAHLKTLSQLRYRTEADVPPLVRTSEGRQVFAFRDFHTDPIEWSQVPADSHPDDANSAIRALLQSMYAPEDALAIDWQRGLLVVFDNTRFFHARTAGFSHPSGNPRHLKRLRIRARGTPHLRVSGLFASADRPIREAPTFTTSIDAEKSSNASFATTFTPGTDDRLLDIFDRSKDPTDAFELRDLYLGRVEHEIGKYSNRPDLAALWRDSSLRRNVSEDEVLASPATVRMVKELFNWFFRDDLYGSLRSDQHIILSSGSVDEESWGLPEVLKDCVRYALDRDWYGYSDSRGREPAREAIAAYENERSEANYGAENVSLTMGGTSAISSISDFILTGSVAAASPSLCAIPNYPPLVEAVSRRSAIRLVPIQTKESRVSLAPLIEALRPDTPLVLLQTVINPTGARVPESEIDRLIATASSSTTILLDECHEWLGATDKSSAMRARPNVIRVSSLSKLWSAPGMKVGWILADSRFISEYYEYASTTFGGPPSIFATLVEFVARMEKWRLRDTPPDDFELRELRSAYGVSTTQVLRAFESYERSWSNRENSLSTIRRGAAGVFSEFASVTYPDFSINMALEFEDWDDSYRCFRDLLRESSVAVFPGILTFCLSGASVRATTGRPWSEIATAAERIKRSLNARQRESIGT